ncbi:MAG: GNAT family N-acetyltransferase [Sedimentisphaerales bacterium]|nr:GNAT family N-acetyltransferase [Sedimentisphaerales bacterium]
MLKTEFATSSNDACAVQGESSSSFTAASQKGKSRRMQLLERMGCFGAGPGGVSIRRAVTADDLRQAYSLVHDCYVEQGYIFPLASGMRMRIFEAMPETVTFVAKAGKQVVGVTSVVFDSNDLGLPSEHVFRDEIEVLRRQGRKIAEITNWAIAPDYRRTAVLTELIRCYVAHLQAAGCDDAIGAISHNHKYFYKLMGFDRVIGSERSYSAQIHDPVILVNMGLDRLWECFDNVNDDICNDVTTLKRYYQSANPYHECIESWNQAAQKAFKDPALLRRLFVEQSDLLTDCSRENLEIIRHRWGDDLFLNVLGHNIIYDGFVLLDSLPDSGI